MSLTDASGTNDTLAQLVELRKILAVAIDGCESNRDLAALSRRYMGVICEIDARVRAEEENGDVAEIIRRNKESAHVSD